MNRRALLRAVAGAALLPVAGCGSRIDPDSTPGGAPSAPGSSAAPPDRASSAPPDRSPPDAATPGTAAPESPVGAVREVREVPVVCRTAVGLAPPVGEARRHRLRQVTLHHTGVPLGGDDAAVPTRLVTHQRAHQARGWSDVAYHYAVDRRGTVYQLRAPHLVGDTGTAYDPSGHLLLVCEGDYGVDAPTAIQLQRLAELVAWAVQHHDLDPTALTGHRDHTITACPGDALQARLPQLRREATHLAAATDVALVEVCGDAASAVLASLRA